MKGIVIAVFAQLLLTGMPVFAADAGRFPHDWYVLPEDSQELLANPNEVDGMEVREGLIFRRGISHVEKSLDKLYTASANAFEEVPAFVGRHEPPSDAPADWVPWHLKEIIMDLGVSLQGTVGVVTAKGAVSAEVYWQQKASELMQKRTQAEVDDGGPVSAPDLVVYDHTSKEVLENQVEKIVDMVMATGRVQTDGRGRMRDGLNKTATELQEIMVDINAGNGSTWQVDSYRVDVSIGASGKVGTGVELGGDVRLSFEWRRSSKEQQKTAPGEDDDEGRRNLRKLLTGVAYDLEEASNGAIGDSSFSLTKFRLGIGLFANAKFGVAKGSLEVKGYAYFKKVAARDPNIPRIIDNSEIPLLTAKAPEQHLQFAKANNVRYETFGDSSSDKVIYYLNRDRFRKGLGRAVKMGSFFVERAEKSENAKWTVYKVKPAFALSLMGAFGVVTVGGEASLQMEYKR